MTNDDISKINNDEDYEVDHVMPEEEEEGEIRIGYGSKKKGFLGNLKKKAETLKDKGMDLGKTTAKGAEGLGNKIDSAIDESVNAAKGLGTSKNETLDLIERLAKMKERGILTDKEFTEKKKDLLDKI